jgi:phosphoribosylanthranilate isomerase
VRTVGPFVTVVGLFVNAAVEQVREAINAVGLDLLQFHGDEDEAYCAQFDMPYLKAVRMSPDLAIRDIVREYPSARGFLFDAWHKNKYGGTGETFDWERLSEVTDIPFVLAGGLTPENIEEAIAKVQPYAVDVSGGVEVSPGVKSPQLIEQFIKRSNVE